MILIRIFIDDGGKIAKIADYKIYSFYFLFIYQVLLNRGYIMKIKNSIYLLGTTILAFNVTAYGKNDVDTLVVTSSKYDEKTISGKQIEKLKGGTNADIFSTVTAVQSNNMRNEAGALDIGIRGLQGEGRVPIYIDGSLQSTHTNRGYQGVSDRTYIDSDLISNMKIYKGTDGNNFKSGAIGGTVEIKTLSVEDVIKAGENSGFLIKLRTSNNNVSATQPEKEGSARRLKSSPSVFDFNNGSATVAWGYRNDKFDTIIAYAKKKDGNYYAGSKGFGDYGTTEKLNSQEIPVFESEEVVNTAFESDSFLLKTGIHLTPEQNIEFIFRNHRQHSGEILAAKWFRADEGSMIQWPLGTAAVKAYSANYNYLPQNNNKINFNTNIWYTNAKLDQLNGLWKKGGEVEQWQNSYTNDRKGLTVSNNSEFDTVPLTLQYGFSLLEEELKPNDERDDYWSPTQTSRHGKRNENSTFINATLDLYPVEISVGTNMHGSETTDYQADNKLKYSPKFDLTSELTYHFNKNVSVFGKSSRAYRMPSLYESTVSNEVFSYDPRFNISPEESIQNEIGLKFNKADLLDHNDQLNIKTSYFINNTKNYISPGVIQAPTEQWGWPDTYTFTNYDNLKLSGVELTADYSGALFYANASATIYTNREVCSKYQGETSHSPSCNELGFAWGLTPTRIPTKTNISVLLGKKFFNDDLDLGVHYKYHSGKNNPAGWMKGTAASAVTEIMPVHVFDLYADYKITPDINVYTTINNITDEYYIQPGSVIAIPEPGRTITLGTSIKF